MDYQSEILDLCRICKTVDLYVSTQSYKNDQMDPEDPNSITEQEILTNCYVIILQELRLLGIEVHCEWEEALSNFHDAKAYAYLLSMMDKNNLLMKLNSQYNNKERFIAIFENSEDSESDLLLAFLEVFFYYFPSENHKDEIIRECDRLYSTNEFSSYMKNVLSMISPISTINIDNFTTIKNYINRIVEGRKKFEEVVNVLIEHCPYIQMNPYLRNAIDTYDEEKISGTDISRYCWAVMSDDGELSDTEKEIKKNILFEHTSHQTHHIEYYHVRHLNPTRDQLVELVSHHVEPGSEYTDFINDVKEMISLDDNNKYFHAFIESDKEFIFTLVNIIKEHYYKIEGDN